jgi:peptide deformylase
MREILVIDTKEGKKALRLRTKPFDFSSMNRRALETLLRKMRAVMREAGGIGLSANQIGLDMRLFVAELPDEKGGQKFYAIFNPSLEKVSEETAVVEEGCLSVPRTYGEVRRPARVTVKGYDKSGKPIKIKAWGLLARVIQHEVDHLNGVLFVDKAKQLYKVERHSS